MAYLVDLPKCQDCALPAAVELRSNRNDARGMFCRRHGNEALRKLRAQERARGEWDGS